jgi:hypothetical protein
MNAPVIPTLNDEQRARLLEAQYLHAVAGSEALMIHLGKTYLNQHDRQHLVVEAIPFAEANYEQLLEMLAERQRALPDERLCDDLATMMLNPPVAALPASASESTDIIGNPKLIEIPKSEPPPVIRRRGRPRKNP